MLVGTISIEKSELLSKMLKREGIPHNVLNAKHHEQEAQIVAQAGKLGAVTIATNMAGRGTDIMLGGNADFLAKSELRKSNLPEELLMEADSFAETDNPEILAVRAQYEALLDSHKQAIASEAEQVRAAGGLYIIGTERHESRRIDNQLRGRSGRQGDPGESRFYLSLEDDLMRLFSTDRVMGMMDSLGLDEDTPIDAKILSNAVENAQKNVESRNFRARKNVLEYDDVMNTQREVIYAQRQKVLDGEDLRVLEYDDVMNTQREVIYAQRQKVLDGEDLRQNILAMLQSLVEGTVSEREVIYAQRQKVLDGEDLRQNILAMLQSLVEGTVSDALGENGGVADEAGLNRLAASLEGIYFARGTLAARREQLLGKSTQELTDVIYEIAQSTYEAKERTYSPQIMRELERVVMLRVVDEYWMDQIDAMDDLKQGIGLRAYGQHDPVVAYKEEGYQMFQAMIEAIKQETVRRMFLVQLRTNQEVKRAYGQHDPVVAYKEEGYQMFQAMIEAIKQETVRRMFLVQLRTNQEVKREKVAKETGTTSADKPTVRQQPVRRDKKVGPNDPCPCGSGKKYKKCCMQKDKLAQ